jgi:endonuclease/exonuclease/phosphatase family metal-dependent hydrolase
MRLRIATFNIENLDIGSKGRPLEARIPTLQAQLRGLDADILCLQEVNGQKPPGEKARRLQALDLVLHGTGYEKFLRAHTVREETGGAFDTHNLVTLSRFPIAEIAQVRHNHVPPLAYRFVSAPAEQAGDVRWERPLLLTAIDVPGLGRVHVINLHLRAPLASPVPGAKLSALTWRDTSSWAEGYYIAELKRSGQALEARLSTDKILDQERDAAIVVCGDFNAEVNDTPLQILLAAPEDTGNAELAWRALVPLGGHETNERQFTVILAGRRIMLDHILVSAKLALACRGVTIDNTALLDAAERDDVSNLRPGSHHAPVVAEFRLADDAERNTSTDKGSP